MIEIFFGNPASFVVYVGQTDIAQLNFLMINIYTDEYFSMLNTH